LSDPWGKRFRPTYVDFRNGHEGGGDGLYPQRPKRNLFEVETRMKVL